MSTSLIILFSILFFIPVIILFVYNNCAEKRRIQKQCERYDNVKHIIDDPNTVKVALWINIDRVNGVQYDNGREYLTYLRNGILNPQPVSVALFEPGEYRFIVSCNSREEYQSREINVTLLPGRVYQLGCNDNGPYLVLDSAPERYKYTL